jgi:ribosomal protein S18 acetylase RimI-like enzyme
VPYVGQDAPYAELTQLYVRQHFQRQGVGSALIEEVERKAVEAGATCVHVITGQDNKEAQAFYRPGLPHARRGARKALRSGASHA